MSSPLPDRPAFILGVTGLMEIHPDDIAAVRSSVQTVFDWIRDQSQPGDKGHKVLGKGLGLPDSTPVVLLSSLAPGADQMVADTALARNCCVRAPLPFPVNLYPNATTFLRGQKDDSGQTVLDPSGLPAATPADQKRQAEFSKILGLIDPADAFHVQLTEDVNKTAAVLLNTLQSDLRDKHRRNLRYRAAGEYVAAYADLLIAICDQDSENKPPEDDKNLAPLEQCSSRHIVQARRRGLTSGLLPGLSAITWADNGPVIRIYARREPKNSAANVVAPDPAAVKAGDIALWHPLDSRPHSFTPEAWSEKQMEAFRDFARRLAGMNSQLASCKPVDVPEALAKLLPENSQPFCPVSNLENIASRLKKRLPARWQKKKPALTPSPCPVLSPKATRLAVFRAQVTNRNRNHYDKQVKKLARDFVCLALFATVLFQVAEYWMPKIPSGTTPPVWLNPLQITAFIIAVACIAVAWIKNASKKKSRLDDWQNDTRALGESLRVQFYWMVSGTSQSVASNFLQRARGEAAWLRAAVSAMAFPYEEDGEEFQKLTSDQQFDRLRRVRHGWIQEQLNFFEDRVHQFQARKHRLHFFANLLLAAGSGLFILNFFANPIRYPKIIEETARHYGLMCLVGWTILMLVGWLFFHFVHHLAWRHHHHKVAQNFRPDPTDTKQNHREHWIHFSHGIHCFLGNWRTAVFLGFVLAFGLAGVIYQGCEHLSLSHSPHQPAAHPAWLAEPEKLISIAKNLLLAIGGLLHWWTASKFLVENVRRYTAMAGLFRGAADRTDSLLVSLENEVKQTTIPNAATESIVATIQDVYVALGREALNENADWLLMHRNKPIEPLSPAG